MESDLATLREERNREREEHLAEILELRELRAELVRGGRGAPLSKERIQNSKSTTERIEHGEERRLPRDSRKTKATLSDIQQIDVDATMIPSTQTPLALLRPQTARSRRTLMSVNEEK